MGIRLDGKPSGIRLAPKPYDANISPIQLAGPAQEGSGFAVFVRRYGRRFGNC